MVLTLRIKSRDVMWEPGAGIPTDSSQTKFTPRRLGSRVHADAGMMCVGLRDQIEGSILPGTSGNHCAYDAAMGGGAVAHGPWKEGLLLLVSPDLIFHSVIYLLHRKGSLSLMHILRKCCCLVFGSGLEPCRALEQS